MIANSGSLLQSIESYKSGIPSSTSRTVLSRRVADTRSIAKLVGSVGVGGAVFEMDGNLNRIALRPNSRQLFHQDWRGGDGIFRCRWQAGGFDDRL